MKRFLDKVERTPGCWLWRGAKCPKGYGTFRLDGRVRKTHRVAYEMWRGPIPDGGWVLHKCDNPSCVNPDHLWIGNNAANVADRVAKGRSNRKPTSPKLTPDQVLLAKKMVGDGMTQTACAAVFGVSQRAISLLVLGQTWKHLHA